VRRWRVSGPGRRRRRGPDWRGLQRCGAEGWVAQRLHADWQTRGLASRRSIGPGEATRDDSPTIRPRQVDAEGLHPECPHLRVRLVCRPQVSAESAFPGLAVRACHDHGVAIRITQPDLAMTGPVALTPRRVAVRLLDHRRPESSGALDDSVEVADRSEPDEYAVSAVLSRVA